MGNVIIMIATELITMWVTPYNEIELELENAIGGMF